MRERPSETSEADRREIDVGIHPQTARWCAVSWSGGKDSALALEAAIDSGLRPGALVTMLDESGERSRSHGLPVSVLRAQAAVLGLPLITRAASWPSYTSSFTHALKELADAGCSHCVFGDIDIPEHRRWCQEVCEAAGLSARHPLWQRDRRELVEHLLSRGWKAVVVVVRPQVLECSILGRCLERPLLDEFDAAGIDLCGENGEFHTLVTDGPLFASRLPVELGGEYAVGDCLAISIGVSA